MRDRRERGKEGNDNGKEREGGKEDEGEAMKYRMPFLLLLLLLLLQSCSCFLPAFVRPATCCLLARFFRLSVSLSLGLGQPPK